jgi:hypothetical protein
MAAQSLSGLCVRVWCRPEHDLVLIYAEPLLEDLTRLLQAVLRNRNRRKLGTLTFCLSGTGKTFNYGPERNRYWNRKYFDFLYFTFFHSHFTINLMKLTNFFPLKLSM